MERFTKHKGASAEQALHFTTHKGATAEQALLGEDEKRAGRQSFPKSKRTEVG